MLARKTALAAALLLATSTLAEAKCDRWGNCYSNYGTSTYGSNSSTGSQWSTRNDNYGATGVDSKGNSWSYSRSTGTYYNYGTGRSCYGKGVNRVCN